MPNGNHVQVEIGARIKKVREALGLTQDQLAEAVGSKKRGIQDNEAGKSAPQSTTLRGFTGLGINANWLLTGEGPMLLKDLAPKPALVYSAAAPVAPAQVRDGPRPPIDAELLQDVLTLLEEELARKSARLDPARKAEVVTLLYEEVAAEITPEARHTRLLRLVSLVA